MSKLPPLPTPFRRSGQQIAEDFNDRVFCDLFSNEQMHAYAAAATEPLLQRIAHLEATASANYGRGHADAHSMLTDRIAEFVAALDEEMVVSHLGVFNPGDDPKKAIKDLMLWSQGVGEYFAGEKAKERIAELERQLEEARKDALEEAAVECDKRAHAGDAGALMAARAIRALKGAKE